MKRQRVTLSTFLAAATTVVALIAPAGPATASGPASQTAGSGIAEARQWAMTDEQRITRELSSAPSQVKGERATLAGPNQRAALAWSCGSRCDYQNPATFPAYYCGQYCYITCGDDAQTIDVAQVQNEYIELRYSPFCQTIWIRGNAIVCCNNVRGAAMTTHPYHDLATRLGRVYLPPGDGVRFSQMLNDAGRCGMGQIYEAGHAWDWTVCY